MKKIVYLVLFGILFLIPLKVNAETVQLCRNTFQIIGNYDYNQYQFCAETDDETWYQNASVINYYHGNNYATNKRRATNDTVAQFAFRFQSYGFSNYYPVIGNDYVLTTKFLMSTEESATIFKNIIVSNEFYTTTRDYYDFRIEQNGRYLYLSIVFNLKIYPMEDFYFDLVNGEGISQKWVADNVYGVHYASVTPLADLYGKVMTIEEKYEKDMSAIEEGMNNMNEKQEETNQKLDGINDTMNNSDVDMDGANSFFGDFSDTDHGGISGVITAPLRFVNKITQTCSPLSFKVLDANVELPCGNTLFWDKPNVSQFRTIWNILFGGAFLYFMITKLFKVIEGLKNPDDSRIEVMKL